MLTRTSLFSSGFSFCLGSSCRSLSRCACPQDGNASAQDASAPMRVARLTSSQGTVMVTDGNNPPAAAQMNLPLLAGVQIATGEDGQAEIEFEDGSVARLTPNTTLSLDRLDIAPGQLFVTDLSLLRGLAYFELRATPEYVYSVNAGGDMVSPVENATVRIDFDQSPASISVLDGTAQVERANSFKVDVVTGSTLREDASDASRYTVTQQIAADTWDQWNADMDQQAAQQSSDSTTVRDNYAGAQGYGWGDMDSSGTWYDVPGQGQVWQPFVADGDADFDPYGNGAWVWYSGTGYLWASGYPWGWTPYYCGAWSFYTGFGWGWAPGATCGGFGWGFGGGGFVVNIVRGPRGYRPIRVPVGRPGPIHPVVPVHIVADTHERPRNGTGPPPNRGPRQIAGVTARPVVPGHMTFVTGDRASTRARHAAIATCRSIAPRTRPALGTSECPDARMSIGSGLRMARASRAFSSSQIMVSSRASIAGTVLQRTRRTNPPSRSKAPSGAASRTTPRRPDSPVFRRRFMAQVTRAPVLGFGHGTEQRPAAIAGDAAFAAEAISRRLGVLCIPGPRDGRAAAGRAASTTALHTVEQSADAAEQSTAAADVFAAAARAAYSPAAHGPEPAAAAPELSHRRPAQLPRSITAAPELHSSAAAAFLTSAFAASTIAAAAPRCECAGAIQLRACGAQVEVTAEVWSPASEESPGQGAE